MTEDLASERYFLVFSHAQRESALEATVEVCAQLTGSGAVPVIADEQWDEIYEHDPALLDAAVRLTDVQSQIELVIVLGGDGTILRAGELVRDLDVPLLGVNLGHVGFLAEAERDDLGLTVARALAGDYFVEERLALAVEVEQAGEVVYSDWSLNEVTVEKAERERMLEVVVEVDGRPLESFGCDGIVMSTPTGSTAYAFSGGGPVVWPEVEALLLVPLAAHALFARPLVVAPDSFFAIELIERTGAHAVIWCDGRRSFELPPGARVLVRRAEMPVRFARLHDAPFTDRLVRKFSLPVVGWRGPARD
ncbi:NAD kinase [Agromyces seonyuensis]|uniref:NAD kinase n=1 Tax=Agromyces seonyuensis TaxID=2662446 RepID=A0A6I4P7P7_9MICO|nr:NAD kinase [Agromyces seonyuensis]MWB99884.1 NAD kinase [Agromyces seonyuensis]